MNPYTVYKLYLGLRLHFTSDTYDVIKMQGHVRCSQQSFARRNDLIGIRRLARKYDIKQVTNFLVANFVSGDKWGGIFDNESETRYKEWVTKVESLGYLYEQELITLVEGKKKFSELFSCKNGHPPILQAYLNKSVSIETLAILNKCLTYTDKLDIYLQSDIIWPDVSRLIKKYSPFLKVNKDKYTAITTKVIQHNFI